jgi:hypothetical protein
MSVVQASALARTTLSSMREYTLKLQTEAAP